VSLEKQLSPVLEDLIGNIVAQICEMTADIAEGTIPALLEAMQIVVVFMYETRHQVSSMEISIHHGVNTSMIFKQLKELCFTQT
jgi:hypothetical protein